MKRVTSSELDRLRVVGLSVSIGMTTGDRARAPFVEDGTATIWKLARKKLVEVRLPDTDRVCARAAFRPTARGWALYDQWIAQEAT